MQQPALPGDFAARESARIAAGQFTCPLRMKSLGAPEKPRFLGNTQKQLDELHIAIVAEEQE